MSSLLQTDEDERGRILVRAAFAMGLYTIDFMLLAWLFYFIIPEIFVSVTCRRVLVVSLLGVNVEILSLIFLAVSLVAGLSASYLLMKSGQTKNTALKRGAKILFYTHAIAPMFTLLFAFWPGLIVLGLAFLVGVIKLAKGLIDVGKEYGSSAAGAGAVLLALGAVLTILAPIFASAMLTAGAALAYLGLSRKAEKLTKEKCCTPLTVAVALLFALMAASAGSIEEPQPHLIIENATLQVMGKTSYLTVLARERGWYVVQVEEVTLVKDSTPICKSEYGVAVGSHSEIIRVRCDAPIERGETYYIVIKYWAWGLCDTSARYTEPFPVVAK